MSGDVEDDVCRRALGLVHELCFAPRARPPPETCLEFSDILRQRGHPPPQHEVSVSLLSVIVTFCGLVLLGVSLFVSWKLCWVPWRHKEGSGGGPPRKEPPHIGGGLFGDPLYERGEPGSDPPCPRNPNAAIWIWGPAPWGAPPRVRDPPLGTSDDPPPPLLGQIQPELYGAAASSSSSLTLPVPTSGSALPTGAPCSPPVLPAAPCGAAAPRGRLCVALRYAFGSQQLVVRVLRATQLPPKGPRGTGGDPYVRIHLLPDRKKKFQTKVHRRTREPVFDETFTFAVPFAELPARRLHFGVYDFDRFARHELVGRVVLENLLEAAERAPEAPLWRDIVEGGGEKADLGELNFSLCYLPTAGRLTVTIIRAANLRAMDLTGLSDPYVKASLMAEGRRLKKRKTSIKRNTLNPSYNEALVFDVSHESVHHVSITLAVLDYDCIGHNEVIGLCRVGSDAEGAGREHWARMLQNPRQPVEHWHTLVEEKALGLTKGSTRDKHGDRAEAS
ncbi:LOW QUALITY PROTEIN: synaptotagmin-3 [Guaruba guarouba]